MNIYNIESRLDEANLEILPALLRQSLLENHPSADFDMVFSLAYDTADQFFLKGAGEIIWGRIFIDAPSFKDIEKLICEISQLSEKFQRKLRPVIFIPPRFSEVFTLLGTVPGKPVFYEYYFLRAGSEQAVALKALSITAKGHEEESFAFAEKPQNYSFYQYARLNREELREIIDLSLEYKQQL